MRTAATPAQGTEWPTESLSSAYQHHRVRYSGRLQVSSRPPCFPLTFLSTTNSFSAAVRLLISTSYLCAARERRWHCRWDNSVLQTLAEQSVSTAVPRAAWPWPPHWSSCIPGVCTMIKRDLDQSRFKGINVQLLSSHVTYPTMPLPRNAPVMGFHHPSSLSQLPLPCDSRKTPLLPTGTLISTVHSPGCKTSQTPNKHYPDLWVVCSACFLYIFLFQVKQGLRNRMFG